MAKPRNLTGQRFGRLTAVELTDRRRDTGARIWKCVCDCGNITYVSSRALRSGNTKSCGCLRRERLLSHGDSRARLYHIWWGMRERCNNAHAGSYKWYGGKGVTICDEWSQYPVFKEWALSHGYNDTLSIDRIDSNGNYTPDNCRWLSQKQQCNNKTSNRRFTYNNVTHTLSEWSEILGIKYGTLRARIYRGASFQQAVENYG